ncbi:MAG: hypothetical protein ABIH82_05000 [Candidatus Woesearchaeota archaeon]
MKLLNSKGLENVSFQRHLISMKDFNEEDILQIIKTAQILKIKRSYGELTNYLQNKTMIMLFEKTSTRTRLSFETAMTELGGHSICQPRVPTTSGNYTLVACLGALASMKLVNCA